MKIKRCLYRQQQQSLINDERSEVVGLFEVEHDGNTGLLLYEAEFIKRDADTTTYTDLPGVDADTVAYGFQQDPPFYLDEEVWNHEPETTEQTDEIRKLMQPLYSQPLG